MFCRQRVLKRHGQRKRLSLRAPGCSSQQVPAAQQPLSLFKSLWFLWPKCTWLKQNLHSGEVWTQMATRQWIWWAESSKYLNVSEKHANWSLADNPCKNGQPMTSGKWLRVSVIWACVKRSTPRWEISCCTSNNPSWKKAKPLSIFVDFQGNIHHIWDCDVHLESLTRLPVSSGTKRNSGPAASLAQSQETRWFRSVLASWDAVHTLGKYQQEQHSTDF